MTPGRYHRENKNKNRGRSLWSIKDSAEDQAHTRPKSGPHSNKAPGQGLYPHTLNCSLYQARLGLGFSIRGRHCYILVPYPGPISAFSPVS